MDALDDLLLLGRSDNISIGLVVQNFSETPPTVRGNVSTIMLLRSNHSDAVVAGRELGLSKEQIELVKGLERGFAVVLRRRVHPKPVLITFPHFNPRPISKNKIREAMAPKIEALMKCVTFPGDGKLKDTKEVNVVETASIEVVELNDAEISLMTHLSKNPVMIREDICKDLKLPTSTLSRHFQNLVKKGYLKTTLTHKKDGKEIEMPFELKPSGARRGSARKFYDFTLAAVERFGNPEWVGKGMKIHAAAISFIGYFYRQHCNGEVFLEHQIGEGLEAADVAIEPKIVAVEICNTTKPAHELNNIKKCLDAGYELVVSASFSDGKRDGIRKAAIQNLIESELEKVQFRLVGDFVGKVSNPESFLPGGRDD